MDWSCDGKQNGCAEEGQIGGPHSEDWDKDIHGGGPHQRSPAEGMKHTGGSREAVLEITQLHGVY